MSSRGAYLPPVSFTISMMVLSEKDKVCPILSPLLIQAEIGTYFILPTDDLLVTGWQLCIELNNQLICALLDGIHHNNL